MGHTIDDFEFTITDKDRVPLVTLKRVYEPQISLRDFGGYGGKLTFKLPIDDPNVEALKEREMHYIRVCCDGVHIFSGYQDQLSREEDIETGIGFVSFVFLPLGQILHWRYGYNLTTYTDHVDDALKDVVYNSCGAGAPTLPTSGLSLAFSDFTVEADKHEASSETVDAINQDIFEACLEYGQAYNVDFDVYFDEDFGMHFQTWYPRRGSDKTLTGAGSSAIIFSDADGSVVAQAYGWDGSNAVTAVLYKDGSADVVASADLRDRFGLRVKMAGVTNGVGAQQELANFKPREYRQLGGPHIVPASALLPQTPPQVNPFERPTPKHSEREAARAQLARWRGIRRMGVAALVEVPGKEFITDWTLGDKVTWISVRQGHGPHDDIISGIDITFDGMGNALFVPTLGRERRTVADKMRGGGARMFGGGGGGAGYTNPSPEGALDHGELAGLADDDHPAYVPTDCSRQFTGNLVINGTLTVQ